MRAFLFQNGYHFAPGRIETVTFMEGLAPGVLAEDEIATWLGASSQPRE